MQQDGPLPHARPGHDRLVPPLVGQLGVNLVADHEQILFHANLGEGIQFRAREYRPRRIGRKVEQQNLGARRRRRHFRGLQPETVLRPGMDRAPLRVRQRDRRGVGNITGLMVKDGLAGIEDGAQGEVDRLAHADRDENLRIRIVGRPEDFPHIPGDFAAQLQAPEIGRVPRPPVLQRVNGCFPHTPRGGGIRLADAQGDDVPAFLHQLKKVADARTRHRPDVLRQKVAGPFHGETASRSARSSSRKRTPASL